MLKTAFAVATVAAALSLGAVANNAVAMPSATPSQLGLAADTGLVQKTAVVCGRWGCRRVVRRSGVWIGPRRRLYGFAGPRPGWGWSSGPGWGWSSGPSWGWSSSPSWGFSAGWGRPGWGWNRW
jgi:hypothetical protein